MVAIGIVGFGILSRRDPGAVTLIIVALTYVAVWLLGALLRSRQQLQAESERRLQLLESEQDLRAREALIRHRTGLALELHDAVGHGVSAMLLQAGAARAVLESGGSTDVARDALIHIESSGRRTMGELDRMLGMLHGDDAVPEPGLRSLADLARESKALGLDVAVHVTGEPRPISQEADRAAYRIVQEALTNAGKHGASEAVEVQVVVVAGSPRDRDRERLRRRAAPSLAARPRPGRDGGAGAPRRRHLPRRPGRQRLEVEVRLPVPAG